MANSLMAVAAVVLVIVITRQPTQALTMRELHNNYTTIFHRTMNRNAASHLWVSFVLDHASTKTEIEIYELMTGFCPISGSPLYNPSRYTLWTGLNVKGALDPTNKRCGGVHFCCWPCVCDLEEYTHTDTVKVQTKDGLVTFQAIVIGDPCVSPEKIPEAASELKCINGKLERATLSDNGFVVIGVIQTQLNWKTKIESMRSERLKDRCAYRQRHGFANGMGKIFIDVAMINPISNVTGIGNRVEPCIGDDRGDYRCNWDNTHRVCAQLVDNNTGQCKKLMWGTQDFWQITDQADFEWSKLICDTKTRSGIPKPSGNHWCICMWATERLIKQVGCDNVKFDCKATDVNYMLNRYQDMDFMGGTSRLDHAKCCVIRKCPSFIDERTKKRLDFDSISKEC